MTDNNDPIRSTANAHRRAEPTHPFTIEVTRYPIHYSDKSAPDINPDALPPIEQLQGMELAYREQPVPEPVLIDRGLRALAWSVFISMVVSLMLVWILPQMGLSAALSLSAIVVVMTFVSLYLSGNISPFYVFRSVAIPPLIALLLYAFASLLQYRIAAAFVFAVSSLAVIKSLGVPLFQFFADWLLTHPRLRPEMRRLTTLSLTEATIKTHIVSASVIALIVVLGMLNNSLATIAGLITCMVLARGFEPAEAKSFTLIGLFRYSVRLFTHVIFYGLDCSGAAGVWFPKMSATHRNRFLVGMLVPNVLMLTAATSAFSLWDFPLVRTTLVEIIKDDLKSQVTAAKYQAITPADHWKTYHESMQPQEPRDEFDIELGRWVSVTPEPPHFEPEEFTNQLLNGSPYVWVVALLTGVTSGKPLLIWVLLLSMIFGSCFIIFYLLACYRPLIRAVYLFERDQIETLDNDERPTWQWFVDRIRTSNHVVEAAEGRIREADHLFWGISAVADFPVLLHKRLLEEHCYIVGQTGSGKTSLGIMPLLMQMLRGTMPAPTPSSPQHDSPQTPRTTDAPVGQQQVTPNDWTPIVILDLKGDPAFFHTIKAEAEARGQEFRFFTPERGLATHVFNPFSNFSTENRTLIQLCQLILDALGLNHGEGYGRSYFTRQNREALFDALNTQPAPKTFQELSDVLKTFRGRPAYPDIFELVSTIHALTQYPQLETIEPVSRPDQAIHMPTVLERRQVVYFWLPAAIESITVREIGKLALFSLLNAAIDRQRSGAEQHRVFLVIDEFQRLAGENFRIILEQARSFGLSVIMANQTMADLNTPTFDLRPTVRTNARVKISFGVTDPAEIEEISKLSGQEIARIRNYSYKGVSPYGQSSRGWSEQFKNRFLISDILGVTDHPRRCILHVTRGSGYSQFGGLPTIVDCFHPLTKEQYDARSNAPWPVFDPDEGLTTSEVDVSDIERQRNHTLVQEQEDILKSLFEKADGKFRGRPQK